jgi:archaellin
MEVRGGIVATSAGGAVTDIAFAVASTASGESIPLDPAATNNRTVIAYRDGTSVDNDVTYTVTPIVGDGDNLLEPGELMVITVNRASGISPVPAMPPNTRFTLEVQTPVGAVLDITRQLPTALDAVMQLH